MMSRHLLALLVCFCTIALADPVRLAHEPALSPDARQIAFNSEREGSRLLYSMPARGGEARQLTFHADGCNLCKWMPDGRGLLVGQGRDFSWIRGTRARRMVVIDARERKAEDVLK